MLSNSLSRVAVVGLATVTLSGLVTVGTASAVAPVPISAPGGYSSMPSNTEPVDKVTRSLGGRVTIPAGQTRYLSSKLSVDDAREVTEVSHMVYCRRPGQTTNAARLVSGQNVLANTLTTLLTRGFVTAPADSALNCEVYTQLVNHAAPVPGHIVVLPSSYLQDVYGDIAAVKQTFNGKELVNSSASANVVSFTAPVGATTVHVIGDVNVTVCYQEETKEDALCKASLEARMNGRNALVGTQLVVNQLAEDGTVCHPNTNGPLAGVFVTKAVHHYKINTWMLDVPVVAGCSRNFVAYTRVTANADYSSIVVEGNNQSVGAVFVP